MERVRFINHRGQQMLFTDYSNLQDTDEILAVIDRAKEVIAAQPENSLKVLTFVRDAKTDSTVKQAMKEYALHNKPYVCASAVVGMSAVQRVLFEAVRVFSNREIHSFDTLAQAKDWLVEQSRAAKSPAEQSAS